MVNAAHDALLAWCSEIGSGTMSEFRASTAYLGLGAGATARVLSQLGHVEFDYDRDRFAAAPAALAIIPRLPGRLLVTGARPYGLLDKLAAEAAASDMDIDVAREGAHQFGQGPSTVYVEADPADAPAFCAQTGVVWACDAATQIARRLPIVTRENATVAHRPDQRFPHARVDEDTLIPRWDLAGAEHGRPGLWLYRTWGNRHAMILDDGDGDGEPRLVLDAATAPYLMRRPPEAEKLIDYHEGHWLLKVNAAAPLPALHARAACLCSGRLPIRRDVAPGVAYHHYVNVDPLVAQRIRASLGVPA